MPTKFEKVILPELITVEENKYITKQEVRDIANIENVAISNKEVYEIYKPVINAVKKVIKGYSYLVIIKGHPALGKSFVIKNTLEGTNYAEQGGDLTPAYLYRILFENNNKILWLKDVSKIFKNHTCLPFYTEVITNNGIKTIDKVDSHEDKIASWNFNENKMEYKTFKKINTGIKTIMKINTSAGILECSPEHQWIIKSPKGGIEKKQTKDLSTDDALLMFK